MGTQGLKALLSCLGSVSGQEKSKNYKLQAAHLSGGYCVHTHMSEQNSPLRESVARLYLCWCIRRVQFIKEKQWKTEMRWKTWAHDVLMRTKGKGWWREVLCQCDSESYWLCKVNPNPANLQRAVQQPQPKHNSEFMEATALFICCIITD